jgi:DNA-binding NtrC family response regulator
VADSGPRKGEGRVGASRTASTLIDTSAASEGEELELLVVEPQKPDQPVPRVTTIPLLRGSLGIGRGGAGDDVILDDPRASKQHARLHVTDDGVEVEDLGSTNGVYFEGERLSPSSRVRVGTGEGIRIGESMLVVRRRPQGERRRGLCEHTYLAARLLEECSVDAASVRPFALVRFELGAAPRDATKAFEPLLAEGGLLAPFAGQQYELLLLPPPSRLAAVLEKLQQLLKQHRLRSGMATFPAEARDAEVLRDLAARRFRGEEHAVGGRVVASAPMLALYDKAARIARSRTRNVLLIGESGAGKDELARYIHQTSERKGAPFVAINCAVFVKGTAASELFGHERGSFTHAQATHRGCFEQADGGTLFLDEIGELELDIQAQLLRVLESGEVRRVGATKGLPVDVRVLTATNVDIAQALVEKRLRSDLYFRISTFTLHVPALRARRADILPLARSFIDSFSKPHASKQLSEEAIALLEAHGWPGNVRELRNVMERAVLLSDGPTIEVSDLDLTEITDDLAESTAPVAQSQGSPPGAEAVDWDSLPLDEAKQRIVTALLDHDCVKYKAAKSLGMGKERLLGLMRTVGLRPTQRPRTPAGGS